MGTPFDAAAGAAGLVSIGLTACKGILEYYNKYQSFRSDLAEACTTIGLLEDTLKDIESKLQSNDLTLSRKDHIGRCVSACKEGILELYITLAKIQKGPPLLQKMVYPFKESTMSKGLQRISELQKSLTGAFLGLNIEILERVSATKEALDAMSEDYSDALSELTGTVTALTSFANAKKICPRISHRTRPATQRSILGVGMHDRYEKIAVLLFHRDCKPAVGQRDPLAEMLALETLLNDRFPCQPKAKRYVVPGLDQTDPRSIKIRIHKWLSDLLFYEDSDNTLLLVHYAGFHSTSSTLGAGSNRDRDALRLRNSAQLDQIVRDEVESFLQISEKSDILMVFDCYYSGKLEGQNFEPIITPPYPSDTTRVLGRKLEFLGSIMSERRAQSTNSRSLTSAFTWSLDKLLSESPDGFTALDIHTKILTAPDFSPSRSIPLSSDPRLIADFRVSRARFNFSHLRPALLPCGAFFVGVVSTIIAAKAASPSPHKSNEEGLSPSPRKGNEEGIGLFFEGMVSTIVAAKAASSSPRKGNEERVTH